MNDLAVESRVPALKGWEVRAVVRHRDGYRCVECGMTHEEHIKRHGRKLDVHRISPGSPYIVDGCVTLCRPCHATKPKSPRGLHDGKWRHMTVTTSPEVAAVIRRLAKEERRSVCATMVILLEEAIKARGEWTDPPADQED